MGHIWIFLVFKQQGWGLFGNLVGTSGRLEAPPARTIGWLDGVGEILSDGD